MTVSSVSAVPVPFHWLLQSVILSLRSWIHVVKEAMEYKLGRFDITLIRSIYNTPIYNRLMYCSGTQLTNLRETSKEDTWRLIYIIYSTHTRVRRWAVMHQSIPPAPSPSPPPTHRGHWLFLCLGWQIPEGGDSWAVKSPGVRTKKEGKCPVLRQHCNIFHWSHSQIVPF